MVDHLQSRVTPWHQYASHVKVRGMLLKMDVYFMVTYMKHYSYPQTIGYDVIVLVHYFQGYGSKLSVFKFLVLWGSGFEMCKIFIRSHMISE